MPLKWRSRLTAAAFVALAIGAIACAALVGLLEPSIGWRGLFLIGGILPLVMVPLIFFALPESPIWLHASGAKANSVADALNRLTGKKEFSSQTAFTVPPIEADAVGDDLAKVGIVALFRTVPLRDTIALWAIIFALQFVASGMTQMGPTVMAGSGYRLADAAQLMVWFNAAGLLASLMAVWLLPKLGSRILYLSLGMMVLAGFTALLFALSTGLASGHPLTITAVLISGFGVTGMSLVGFPLAANVYPTNVRATGVGLAAGIGRLGSVLAPTAFGLWIVLRGSAHAFELQIPGVLLLIIAALTLRPHIPALRKARPS